MGFKPVDRAKARQKKHRSIRKKIVGTTERPRLAVFKSSKNIFAQLIDDSQDKTITGVSTLNKELQSELEKAKTNLEKAQIVGKTIGERAKEHKIEEVVFDRGGFLYHGRVKALAEAARAGGLDF